MSKEKKSMDDVLASIRRIIKTDPNAAPPDAASLPVGLGIPDDTAKSVLEKLRDDDDDTFGKPLSTSDDPDETARAVLDALRKQAEAEKGRASPPPEIDQPIEEPPATGRDADDVPVLEGSATPAEAAPAAAGGRGRGRSGQLFGAGAADRPDRPGGGKAADAAAGQPQPPARRKPEPEPVMLDEAAIEAMVRRIVRDELMGEMGRRMTKNVQKMIRDEIARGRLEDK